MDKYIGKIDKLNKIIISDPHYEGDVWCRYEKDFENEDSCNVEILIENKELTEEYEGKKYSVNGISFNVLLLNDKYKKLSNLIQIKDTESYSYHPDLTVTNYTIGMDTAQVAIGINEKAKEIEDFSEKVNYGGLDPEEKMDLWRPDFSLKTLTDGVFGEANEIEYDNSILGINFCGWLDEDTNYSIDNVVEYLKDNLCIKDLVKESMDQEIEK